MTISVTYIFQDLRNAVWKYSKNTLKNVTSSYMICYDVITQVGQTRVEPTVYTILCVTASCGIVLGATFLAVNIKYRHQK